MAKIGDVVRYLNAVGGGRIVDIKGNLAYVEEDGFETPVLLKECVVVTSAQPVKMPDDVAVKPVAEMPSDTGRREDDADMAVEETPEGERLNIVIGYEPSDLKHLSSSTFDTYLVNDSNYYLYFTYLTRGDEAKRWTTRYAGVVEPGIQLFLGEVDNGVLAEMDRVAFQYVAFKRDKEFDLKSPALVEQRLDTTKFFKLHCFRENVYFDKPVIALDIVKNDIPLRITEPDYRRIEKALNTKKTVDRQMRRSIQKKHARPAVVEVDLHIAELIDDIRGLSNADMLNLQVDKFREVMDANLKNHGQKIVFIHGKGEGVLRQALMKELNHRYKGHDVQDASFREYGFGATQVTIK